ncbi:MAG TPA: creatininase family protein [Chloroflexota bacterium]
MPDPYMTTTELAAARPDTAVFGVGAVEQHGPHLPLGTDFLWIQELNATRPELRLIMPSAFGARPGEPPIFESAHLEVHAGECETSVQLSFNAEHVGDQRPGYIPPVGREFLDYAVIEQLSPTGIWGNPSKATVEKGERAIAAAVRASVAHVEKSFDFLARAKQRQL